MRFTVSLLLYLVLFSACSEKAASPAPAAGPVLPEDSMKMLMVDMFITESCIRQKEREGKNVAAFTQHYYNLLLDKYQMDSLKIKRSFDFYAAMPEKLKELSSKAVDSLIIMETMIQKAEN